jgi:hypothetical protein
MPESLAARDDNIIESVAYSGICSGRIENEIFNVVGKRRGAPIAHDDRVEVLSGLFDDGLAPKVICVVAEAANENISTGAAERVIAGRTDLRLRLEVLIAHRVAFPDVDRISPFAVL